MGCSSKFVRPAPKSIGYLVHGWIGTRYGCEEKHSVMVRGAQSERLLPLLAASDEVIKGPERCLKPSVERPWEMR